MSFFGVELSSQINRMMFEIRLSLSRNKFYPNFRSIYRAFSEYDPELSGFIHPVHFEKVYSFLVLRHSIQTASFLKNMKSNSSKKPSATNKEKLTGLPSCLTWKSPWVPSEGN